MFPSTALVLCILPTWIKNILKSRYSCTSFYSNVLSMPMKKKITKLNRSCRVRTLHRQKGSGSTITLTEPPPHTGSTSLVDVGLCILNQLSASLQFFLWNFLIFLNRELRNDTKFCDLQQQPCFPLEALSQPGHQLLSARSHPELLL